MFKTWKVTLMINGEDFTFYVPAATFEDAGITLENAFKMGYDVFALFKKAE